MAVGCGRHYRSGNLSGTTKIVDPGDNLISDGNGDPFSNVTLLLDWKAEAVAVAERNAVSHARDWGYIIAAVWSLCVVREDSTAWLSRLW